MSAVARERMMCGERVKVPVLVSANFCLCRSVPTFVCVGQCQLLFVLVSANVCVGQCQLLFVLVSANVCLCWPVPTFVCVGQCQRLFVLVSANFCFHHTCIYEITGSGFRSVV